MTEYPIHPIAELFPMLPEDELQELAEDIKQRGLLSPITLDGEGRIIDGRNRYAACVTAGVQPYFQTYDGPDVAGYALAANLARRHLSKGQKAMIAAQALLVSSNSQREAASSAGISQQRVGQAVVVRDHASDLVADVAAGSRSLDEAYKIAQDRKAARSSEAALTEKLATDAPDLADKVRAHEMPLAEAVAAARARAEESQRQRRVATALLCDLVGSLAKTKGSDTAVLYQPDLASVPLTERALLDARDALDGILGTLKDRGLL